jgi:hypothetical protein
VVAARCASCGQESHGEVAGWRVTRGDGDGLSAALLLALLLVGGPELGCGAGCGSLESVIIRCEVDDVPLEVMTGVTTECEALGAWFAGYRSVYEARWGVLWLEGWTVQVRVEAGEHGGRRVGISAESSWPSSSLPLSPTSWNTSALAQRVTITARPAGIRRSWAGKRPRLTGARRPTSGVLSERPRPIARRYGDGHVPRSSVPAFYGRRGLSPGVGALDGRSCHVARHARLSALRGQRRRTSGHRRTAGIP